MPGSKGLTKFNQTAEAYISRFRTVKTVSGGQGKCRPIQMRGDANVYRSARAIAKAHGIGLSAVVKSLRTGEPAFNGKTYIHARSEVTVNQESEATHGG